MLQYRNDEDTDNVLPLLILPSHIIANLFFTGLASLHHVNTFFCFHEGSTMLKVSDTFRAWFLILVFSMPSCIALYTLSNVNPFSIAHSPNSLI